MTSRRYRVAPVWGLLLLAACGGGSGGGPGGPQVTGLIIFSGGDQAGPAGAALPSAVTLRLQAANGDAGDPGTAVLWTVLSGGGSVSADTSFTDLDGKTSVAWTLGPAPGGNELRAMTAAGDSVRIHATGTGTLAVLGGGNNQPERFGSDLWVANGYGYTGSWNWIQRTPGVGAAIRVFQLDGTGAPALVDSVVLPSVTTVSDLEVSPDGQWLVVTTEGNVNEGLYVFSLANPAAPAQVAFSHVSAGLHTGSLAVIGGKLYAFTAKNPSSPALVIFDISAAGSGTLTPVSTTAIPPTYGIHDTFVRDGICFAFVWNEGVYIYDVGKGIEGGTPSAPVKLGAIKTAGGEAHNGWWFWNPVTGSRRYLFVGQEGPGSVGASSSGDIHVVDVSDLAHPTEVATFSLPGSGTHNFWMDETAQRLYAAYYDGGVVAVDVSGTLSGDLSSRLIARIRPGGSGNTYTWGVMLAGGSLYAMDMLSGLWQLKVP